MAIASTPVSALHPDAKARSTTAVETVAAAPAASGEGLDLGKAPGSSPAPARAQAEAKLLEQLSHGPVAAALERAGVPRSTIRVLQRRAARVEQLAHRGVSRLEVALAANHVSQLMPGLYARYRNPVPPAVRRLDYLDREIGLRSMAGQARRVQRLVTAEASTWTGLRRRLVSAGGADAARRYDAHVRALRLDRRPAAVQRQALTGLDLVDLMEKAFLAK